MGTRGRGRRGESQLEGGLTKQELAAKTIAEQRKERYSMQQNLRDSKAERERDRREKIARDRILMPVKPRKQPPRDVAADIVYACNTDSEDLDSDVSTDSCGYSEVVKDQTYVFFLHKDSEIISWLHVEEFRDKAKKRRKFTKKAKVNDLLF